MADSDSGQGEQDGYPQNGENDFIKGFRTFEVENGDFMDCCMQS
jgi:hypothetical protein